MAWTYSMVKPHIIITWYKQVSKKVSWKMGLQHAKGQGRSHNVGEPWKLT